MKGLIISGLLISFSIAASAQRTILTILPGTADVTMTGKFVTNPVKIAWNEEGCFVVAAKTGYITYGESLEEIMKRGNIDTVRLKQIKKYPSEAKSMKIGFASQFNEGSNTGELIIKNPEVFSAISPQMIEWGFRIVGTGAQYEEKREDPNLLLGIEITENGVDYIGGRIQVSLIVNWHLYDIESKKVIYKSTTGGFANAGRALKEKGAIILALKDAAVGLMSDTIFQQTVTITEDTAPVSSSGPEVTIPGITPAVYNGYGDMIKHTLGSVVTVKTDFGFGSGFIISKTGYLLTCYHVVSEAKTIEVMFENGFNLEGTLISYNAARDVALIKVNGNGFKPLVINADDEAAGTGTDVIAIGTPTDLKLTQTVTKGIVSGKRELENKNERKFNYIQTDVPVNPGNSGGPLINKSGEVIGIVAKKRMEKGIEGLGFAIPVGEAIDALNIKIQ